MAGGLTSVANSIQKVYCSDVIGNRKADNPFSLERTTISGMTLYGAKGGPTGYKWVNWPYEPYSPYVAFLPAEDIPISRILASTGPLTPKVNLPLFFIELKDIPRMLKHAGDFLHGLLKKPLRKLSPQEHAGYNLAYQFGWKPLIEDLWKLLKFSEAVAKRQQELKKAHSTTGLKRRIQLTDMTESNRMTDYVESVGGIKTSTFNRSRTMKSWATIRWTVRDKAAVGALKEPGYTDSLRSALGLNRGIIPIAIWKAIPWTWLIDWFADLSNMLTASYNMLYYEPSSLCYMRKRTVTWVHPTAVVYTDGIVFSSGEYYKEDKYRKVIAKPTNLPTLSVPYIDTFKLSILGSLSVLSISRGIPKYI